MLPDEVFDSASKVMLIVKNLLEKLKKNKGHKKFQKFCLHLKKKNLINWCRNKHSVCWKNLTFCRLENNFQKFKNINHRTCGILIKWRALICYKNQQKASKPFLSGFVHFFTSRMESFANFLLGSIIAWTCSMETKNNRNGINFVIIKLIKMTHYKANMI